MVIDAESVQDIEQCSEEGEERGCNIDVVVAQVVALRNDGGICLQDRGTHVQNACGAMVQAVQDSPGLKSFVKPKQVGHQEHQGDEKGGEGDIQHPSLQQGVCDVCSSHHISQLEHMATVKGATEASCALGWEKES